MADTERRNGRGLVPFRLPLPNPLAWIPRPRFGRRASAKRNFASASVAISETVLSSSVNVSAPPPPSKVPLKPASDVFAGALARAASQSTIHPLDTFKVRMQTKRRVVSAAPPAGLSKIGQLVPPEAGARSGPFRFDAKSFGQNVLSLYKGVLGAASGAGIAIGTYFAFYGVSCNMLSRHTDMTPPAIAFVSGGIAAAGSSVVKVPLAVCIRSVQAGVYPNVFDACKQIVGKAGVAGLFTGFLPTLLEDVPDMAIKFAAYESMRQVHKKVYKGRPATVQEDFAMGATAGALAAAATTPLDVIKTNMMCSAALRPTMFSAASAVHASGGPAAFFRGVGPRALSNGINSAVFFCFFEALRGAIAQHKHMHALAQAGNAARPAVGAVSE